MSDLTVMSGKPVKGGKTDTRSDAPNVSSMNMTTAPMTFAAGQRGGLSQGGVRRRREQSGVWGSHVQAGRGFVR